MGGPLTPRRWVSTPSHPHTLTPPHPHLTYLPRWLQWSLPLWQANHLRGRHARAHHRMVARDHRPRPGQHPPATPPCQLPPATPPGQPPAWQSHGPLYNVPGSGRGHPPEAKGPYHRWHQPPSPLCQLHRHRPVSSTPHTLTPSHPHSPPGRYSTTVVTR